MRIRVSSKVITLLLSSTLTPRSTTAFVPTFTHSTQTRTISYGTIFSKHLVSYVNDDLLDNTSQLPSGDSYIKYEMVDLPDAMLETTIFIGNLCEFVTDDMLSDLFQEVSKLQSIPSVVARKPNTSSLKYGFATFPSVEEKEAAIEKFNGYQLNSRPLKVEPILRPVRVPGKLVAYTLGPVKKTPAFDAQSSIQPLRRISRDDVLRLSRGQPSKTKGYGSRSVPHRLNESERDEFDRAARKGYVTLDGTGWRRGRKGSPLGNSHRQWCDARGKPQILLCRASGGRVADNVIVDFSPLRLGALSEDKNVVMEFLIGWKTDVFIAAENAGMVLKEEYVEDNTWTDDIDLESDDTIVVDVVADNWAAEPIWRLPTISAGVFEGERVKAKAMAKELATLWSVADDDAVSTAANGGGRVGAKNRRNAGAKGGGKTKMKGMSRHRGGHRQRWKQDLDF